jgi:glutamyl-tRNA synthetase
MMRVRFAPSPTGYLHVGGARTALFNWLLARKHGGVFVLRIEDTDQDRNKAEHVQAIIDGMTWLGLSHDEGPFLQSDRFDEHREQAKRLISEGHAYPIFASDFKEGEKRPLRPNLRSRAGVMGGPLSVRQLELTDRMANEPYAIVFRVPDGKTEWEDLVHGRMSFDNDTIEDFILVRADGVPLYNMACTSDDIHHRITHVLRGDDHISNTPKQIMLYRALGAEVPQFGHMPMILGPDGQRLSKRHGATAVGDYAGQGILPEAMVNFLALLGWNPGDDKELMKLDEMIQLFSPDRINKKAAVFDTQKLEWMNGRYLPDAPDDLILSALEAGVSEAERGVLRDNGPTWTTHLVGQFKSRCRTIVELVKACRPYLSEPERPQPEVVIAAAKVDAETTKARLSRIGVRLMDIKEWTPEAIEATLRKTAEELEVGFGKLVQPLRIALTGAPNGPGIDQTVYLLGRDNCTTRLAGVCLSLRDVSADTAQNIA